MAQKILIQNGIVLSMVEGQAPSIMDILLEKGRISAVGHFTKSLIYPEMENVNALGYVVMLGLINTNTHTP